MSETVFRYTYIAPRNQEIQSIRKQYMTLIKRNEVTTMNMNDQEFIVQKIRSQYTEKQNSKLDALKSLDAKVKKPANVVAYVFGAVSAIVMGTGMSLVMTDIGQMIGMSKTMVPGIVIGVLGLGMALMTYPVYKRVLNSRKKKFAPQVMALSDKIMQG